MVKKYKPTTPALRSTEGIDYSDITSDKPYKGLVKKNSKHWGRNNQGRKTVKHRGGGSKRSFRIIDFKRNKDNIPAKIASIEYDPNRTARIALLNYKDGEKRYILAPIGVSVGETVISGENAEIKAGNTLPLKNIPTGTVIHNIELNPGRGAQLVRSAGASAQIVAKDRGYAVVRLSSGEQRLIHGNCRATIGQLSNPENRIISLGKAGRTRRKGRRPHVRGSVKNAVDHPHGGGEGKAPIGLPHPSTPKGAPTIGYKTRNKKKASEKFIISRKKK